MFNTTILPLFPFGEFHLSKNLETETIIKEHGYRRLIIRKGKTRRQKTEILKKNNSKVVLANIGKLQFYCYPYEFPDVIFAGTGQESQVIDKYDLRKLFKIYNKAKWFLNGSWELEKQRTKPSKIHSSVLKNAYNSGLKKQKETENERKSEPH